MKENTLYTFDKISKYSKYSKLNYNYDKMFGNRCLKEFIRVNKRPKIIKKISLLEDLGFTPPQYIKPEAKDPHEFVTKILLTKKKKGNSTNNYNYHKIVKTHLNDKKHKKPEKKNFFHFRKKNSQAELISLDPFKYNPNYNAIFKKVPYVKIIEPNSNKEAKSSSQSNSKSKNSINNSNERENSSKKKKKKNISTNNLKLPLVNNRNFTRNDINNHALRFSKYGNYKSYLSSNDNENGINHNNIILNSPKKDINSNKINLKKIVSINFNKMMSRRDKDFINYNSLKIPSFDRYSPKYDLVRKESPKISFSYHNMDNDESHKKRNLLRKIISSYNVGAEFQMISDAAIDNNNNKTTERTLV